MKTSFGCVDVLVTICRHKRAFRVRINIQVYTGEVHKCSAYFRGRSRFSPRPTDTCICIILIVCFHIMTSMRQDGDPATRWGRRHLTFATFHTHYTCAYAVVLYTCVEVAASFPSNASFYATRVARPRESRSQIDFIEEQHVQISFTF